MSSEDTTTKTSQEQRTRESYQQEISQLEQELSALETQYNTTYQKHQQEYELLRQRAEEEKKFYTKQLEIVSKTKTVSIPSS